MTENHFVSRNTELTIWDSFGIMHVARGDVSERFKEAVLKTVDVRASVGSNPTISAIFSKTEYAEVPKWL